MSKNSEDVQLVVIRPETPIKSEEKRPETPTKTLPIDVKPSTSPSPKSTSYAFMDAYLSTQEKLIVSREFQSNPFLPAISESLPVGKPKMSTTPTGIKNASSPHKPLQQTFGFEIKKTLPETLSTSVPTNPTPSASTLRLTNSDTNLTLTSSTPEPKSPSALVTKPKETVAFIRTEGFNIGKK